MSSSHNTQERTSKFRIPVCCALTVPIDNERFFDKSTLQNKTYFDLWRHHKSVILMLNTRTIVSIEKIKEEERFIIKKPIFTILLIS